MPQRIDREKRRSVSLNRKQKSKSVTQLFEKTNTVDINADKWILPETEQYVETNNQRRKSISTIETDEQQQVVSTKKLPTPFDEVKSYLKKKSLVSKRLTIFDVLYPTSITVKEPHHIQVIDRYVLAKVWDDILPFTYGSYANKFRLVNHYAVDLEKYEAKLKDLLKDYHQFTAKFIWKCLDDEHKRKIGPHIYWISLSTEDQKKYAQEITKDEYINESALEFFAWRKLTKDEQNNLLQRPPIYHEQTQVQLKNALKDAAVESALQGVTRMDVEIKRAIKFLQISIDLRQYQKRAENESKQKLQPKPVTKGNSWTDRNIGQRVICRYDGDGYFYPGTIQKNRYGRLIVLFDMDIEQEIIGHVLLPINSNNQLNLFLQDCVLARQLREETEEYWAPGLVLCLPSSFALPPNLHKIQIFDPFPKQIYVDRKDMIRISLTFFQRSVLYLQNIYRKSGKNGFVIIREPTRTPSPPISPDQLATIFRELLDPLTEKVDNLSKSCHERYNQLQTALEDQMGAIRILQERPYKPQVKVEYAQTIEIPTPPPPRTPSPPPPAPPPPRPRPRPPAPPPPRPRPPPKPDSISTGTQVYAVWSQDDGLVYQGTVLESNYSNHYKVERNDLPGVTSDISRNNIFPISNGCPLKNMETDSFALIKYPNDSRHCLCPAVIHHRHHHEPKTKVRFYDCDDAYIANDEMVIPINEQQFERYVRFRIEKENSLLNQAVVGLNNRTKSFMLGEIKRRVGTGHRYLIEWYDRNTDEQEEEHLFGAIIRRNEHQENGYVLAIDKNDDIYKPAITKSLSNDKKSLKIQFIHFNEHGESLSPRIIDVPWITTFVITKTYYNTIIEPLYK